MSHVWFAGPISSPHLYILQLPLKCGRHVVDIHQIEVSRVFVFCFCLFFRCLVWFLLFAVARNKQKAVLFTNPLGKACYELNAERVTWIILVIWLVFSPLGREISSWEIWWDLLSDDGFDGWARKCMFILNMFETLFVKVYSRYSSTGVGERPLRFLMFLFDKFVGNHQLEECG